MPDEPNKKMDDLLRAYAEDRRKEPEATLHPATRKILQGEVQRVFGSREPRSWWHELRSWWPQIAFGGSLCLILGIAILTLRHTPPATEEKSGLAPRVYESREHSPEALIKQKADATPSDASNTRAEPEDVSLGVLTDSIDDIALSPEAKSGGVATGPAFNLGRERVLTGASPIESETTRNEAVKNQNQVDSRQLRAAPPGAPKESQVTLQQKFETALKEREPVKNTSAESSQATSLRTDSETSAEESLVRQATRPAARASSPPPMTGAAILTPEKLSIAAEMTNLGAARRLNFVRTTNTVATYAGSVNPQATPTLSSFQVEQMGTNLRFYDQDGSVYLGSLEPTNVVSFTGTQVAPPNDQAVIDNSAAYFFRAQGTNLTLGRDVVLTGNYFENTNRQPSSLNTFSIAPNARPQSQPLHLIIGNATVDETNQIPLRAVSKEP